MDKIAVLAMLTKWRQRDEYRDSKLWDEPFDSWRGTSDIANAAKLPKPTVRAMLSELADAGLIERGVYANGTFYRGRPQHNDHVHAYRHSRPLPSPILSQQEKAA